MLTADNPNRRSYSLFNNEIKSLKRGSFQDSELHYLASDFRIENMIFPDFDLRFHDENDTLVIFTHEWALSSRYNRFKLERTLYIMKENYVKYIN